MKKKLLVALMTAIMLVTPVMTAVAAPSTSGLNIKILSVIDRNGEEVKECHEVLLRELLEKDRLSADNVEEDENLKIVLGDDYSEDYQIVGEVDAYVYDPVNKEEIVWEEAEYHFPITVTFLVPGVTSDSNVAILHGYDGYNGNAEDGTIEFAEWHKENVISVGENTVTVVFEHLSPLIFLVDNSPEEGTAGGTTDGTTGGVTSPTTGENNTVFYVGLCVIVAVTGAVATRKKTA